MNLKIGGNNVGKIMYNGQEFGNRKLEPGTILYISVKGSKSFKDAHLLSTTKKWENINGINISSVSPNDISHTYDDLNITGDDFKSLDTEKEYTIYNTKVTVSRSIVDGEYRLNISGFHDYDRFVIKAL
jgi:hypothetical protein